MRAKPRALLIYIYIYIYIQKAPALGRGRVASSTIGRLYPGEITRFLFYRRLNGPQDQSRHEGVKKFSNSPRTGIEPVPSSPQPSALSQYIVWSIFIYLFNFVNPWNLRHTRYSTIFIHWNVSERVQFHSQAILAGSDIVDCTIECVNTG